MIFKIILLGREVLSHVFRLIKMHIYIYVCIYVCEYVWVESFIGLFSAKKLPHLHISGSRDLKKKKKKVLTVGFVD